MLRHAVTEEMGPVAVRYPRGGEGLYRSASLEEESVLFEGDRLTMVCYGTVVDRLFIASELLRAKGIEVELIKLNRILPNSFSRTLRSLRKTGRLLFVEEVCAAGCVGERLLVEAQRASVELRSSALLNLGEGVVTHGSNDELLRSLGLDAGGIAARALSMLEGSA